MSTKESQKGYNPNGKTKTSEGKKFYQKVEYNIPGWVENETDYLRSAMSYTNSRSLEEYKESMKNVYSTSVNESTLDEAPMAYKSLEDIMDVIKESVDVIEVLKPIYNFKASQ